MLLAKRVLVSCPLLFAALFSQSNDEGIYDGEIDLEAFEVIVNAIDVIDGFTGDEYIGDHPVVWQFVDTFREYLMTYHKKLLQDEIAHMNFRWETGVKAEQTMIALLDSFDMEGFQVNKEQWLVREDAITRRLITKPFFKIEALVVWDLERLDRMRPIMPDTQYAKDIHYNEELGKWERRVTTRWKVSYWHPNDTDNGGWQANILKQQGLNLDTNRGFHLIENGLTHKVHPGAFYDVKLTYPIFFSYREPVEEQVKYLNETYITNLYHIYDPYSWIAHRETRFRGGFAQDVYRHVEDERLKLNDREWFDRVFANLLNDAVTMEFLGYNEVYDLHAWYTYRNFQNVLGEGLDLLNWKKGEKREVEPREINTGIWINFNHPGGARWIVLDAYMRHTDRFLAAIRNRLLNLESRSSGKQLITEAIEEVTGMPFDKYYPLAKKAQEGMIAQFRDRAIRN